MLFYFTGGRGLRGVFQILRGRVLQLFIRESTRQEILSSDIGIGQDRDAVGQIRLVCTRSDVSVCQRNGLCQRITVLHLGQ